jgi:hypothetical protein
MIGTNGSVWWKWGDIFDDNGTTNGVSSPITFGGTFFLFDHVQFQTAGEAISEMINFTANTTADLTPINGNYTAQPLDYIYSGAQGRIRYCPMFGLNATEACTMSYFTQSADKFITNVGAGGPAGASWTSSASAGALPSTCSVGSLASNTGATTASTALYVCSTRRTHGMR